MNDRKCRWSRAPADDRLSGTLRTVNDADRLRTADEAEQLAREWSNGAPASWDNLTVPEYLAALAGWLRDCDGYYANRGVPTPANTWTIVRDALHAARVYE